MIDFRSIKGILLWKCCELYGRGIRLISPCILQGLYVVNVENQLLFFHGWFSDKHPRLDGTTNNENRSKKGAAVITAAGKEPARLRAVTLNTELETRNFCFRMNWNMDEEE